MSGVLVLGALHHDVVVSAPRLPLPDETLPGEGVDYRFGGKGGNQAVAAARMGAGVNMAGRVGRDAAGSVLLAGLEAAGVDVSLVQATDAPSGMSVAISLPSGDYGAVIVSGANLENTGDVSLSEPPATVILQNEIPEDANLALVGGLPEATRLIVNAAPARTLHEALARRVDVLVVNRVEAEAITGLAAPEDAARDLDARVKGAVVLTMGGQGAIAVLGGDMFKLLAHKVDVVSTHGAGDMFTGALAARLTDGVPLAEALDFSMAAAALFVSVPADRRASIGRHEVEAFLAR